MPQRQPNSRVALLVAQLDADCPGIAGDPFVEVVDGFVGPACITVVNGHGKLKFSRRTGARQAWAGGAHDVLVRVLSYTLAGKGRVFVSDAKPFPALPLSLERS